MHDDELRFISDINAKKENAWKRLYQNYYPALCNYASRIIQDEVIVEDIVQESLINLWDSSATFQNIRSLTGWLYQAVYTRSLNTIRDQARTNKLHQNLWESVKEELTEEMAINSAIEEEILHKFRTIITQLSPQQQEIKYCLLPSGTDILKRLDESKRDCQSFERVGECDQNAKKEGLFSYTRRTRRVLERSAYNAIPEFKDLRIGQNITSLIYILVSLIFFF